MNPSSSTYLSLLVVGELFTAANRSTLRAYLAPAGHTVQFATNGDEALWLLQTDEMRPDLVLLDHAPTPADDAQVPQDGYALCPRIKAAQPDPYLQVFLMPSGDMPWDTERAIAARLDGCLRQPISKPSVLEALTTARRHHDLETERRSLHAVADQARPDVEATGNLPGRPRPRL